MNAREQQDQPSVGRLRRSAAAGGAEGLAVDETVVGCRVVVRTGRAFAMPGEDAPDRRPPPTRAAGAAGPEPATVAVGGTAGGPDVTGAGAAGTGTDETGSGTVTGGAGAVTSGTVAVTVATGVGTVTVVGTGGGVTAAVVTGVDSVTAGGLLAAERLVANREVAKKPLTPTQTNAPAARVTPTPLPAATSCRKSTFSCRKSTFHRRFSTAEAPPNPKVFHRRGGSASCRRGE